MRSERIHDLERRAHDLDIGPARYVNLVLGAWTLVSTFLWRHSEPQFLVTIAVGAILAILAPFASARGVWMDGAAFVVTARKSAN